MPQRGLLFIMLGVPMMLLPGAHTPVETTALALQPIMQGSPARHFVAFAKSILLHGVGIDAVRQQFLATFSLALVVLTLALRRFRQITAASVT